MDPAFLQSDFYTYVVIPLLIFVARVCDVSIGTIRILTLSRGYKLITVILGFFELMVWLLAIGQVFQNLNSMSCYIAYAGGFAIGNYVGMTLEERLALGTVLIRLITKKPAIELIEHLKKENYRYTLVKARGSTGEVDIIFLVAKRRLIKKIITTIKTFHPNAFFTVEDVRQVREGIFNMNVSTPLESDTIRKKGK